MDILANVKNHLDITWDDPEGDKKLSGFVMSGMRYLNGIAGETLNYADLADPAYILLLEYVRYARSNALEKFQPNYQHELLALQIDKEVLRHGPEQNSDL